MAKKPTRKNLKGGLSTYFSGLDEEELEDDLTTKKKVVEELAGSIADIPVKDIELNPYQPRKDFDETALAELSQSIKEHGLIQPLTLRKIGKTFQLISGERRLRASKMAGLDKVPAYIRIANDKEMAEMALIENIQRENLNAIEVAITYSRLIEEFDLTHNSLSDRVGKSRENITQHLGLLKLPVAIQEAVREKKISMGHARALSGLSAEPALQRAYLNKIIEEKLSVRAIEQLVSNYKNGIKNGPNPPIRKALPKEYQDVKKRLKSALQAKTNLKVNGDGSGRITIDFLDTEDLNRLLDIIED